MTTKSRRDRGYDKIDRKNLEERNRKVRARFEKEAHDRERQEIDELKENYENWILENSLRQLMNK